MCVIHSAAMQLNAHITICLYTNAIKSLGIDYRSEYGIK